MSEKANQAAENPEVEVVRKLVVPAESQGELQDGDCSPTKVEQDLTAEVLAKSETATLGEVEVVRKRIVSEQQPEDEEDDRSPTKVERHLDVEAIAKTEKATPQTHIPHPQLSLKI
jgi:hypothetical protein